MIGHLKYALPSIALASLLVMVGWTQVQQWISPKKPTLAQTTTLSRKNNTATRPEYKNTDEKNQLYTITADHGVESSAEIIDLTHPQMMMNLKSGEVVTLSSSSGKLDKTTNKMHLVGNVTLTHSQGYALETAQAWIDCNQGSAYGDNPIWGNGPAGTINAKGFRLEERGTKVSFIGRAQLLLKCGEEKKK